MQTSEDKTELADDTLHGTEEISLFLYGTPNKKCQVYRMATEVPPQFRPPFFKMGSNSLCARKSRLLRWIEDQESARSEESAGEPV